MANNPPCWPRLHGNLLRVTPRLISGAGVALEGCSQVQAITDRLVRKPHIADELQNQAENPPRHGGKAVKAMTRVGE